jgi:hypothetical protein
MVKRKEYKVSKSPITGGKDDADYILSGRILSTSNGLVSSV